MRNVHRCLTALGFACLLTVACSKSPTAPVPSVLTKVAGDSQFGFPGDTLVTPLRVRVTSSAGEPVPGVAVKWTSGNATVSAANTVTDADGMASISAVLSLQPAHGAIEAVAGPSDALVGWVEFRVEIQDPCNFAAPLTVGTPISGTIRDRDCAFGDGSYLDTYSFDVPALTRVRFAMNSLVVDPFLFVVNHEGALLGGNDSADATTANARVDVLLAPDTGYRVWANTFGPGQFGAYQLVSTALPPDISDCVMTWVISTTSAQTLPATGCPAPDGTTPIADHFAAIVFGGNHLAVSMTAAGFAAQVRIYSGSTVLASAVAAGPGQTATASYDVPGDQAGSLVLQCSDAAGGSAGGAYSLGVTMPRAPAWRGPIFKTRPVLLSSR